MRLTHYGHACVMVEDPTGSAGRILIDPGNLGVDIDGVRDVDAVLITHEHPDHLDVTKLERLRQTNPQLVVYANPGTPAALSPDERERACVLASDHAAVDTECAGWPVDARTSTHATIYPALPDITNNSYLIGHRIWCPGDSFVEPEEHIDVLLLPIGAPWLKLSEAVDYLRAVAPRIAIPVHQGGLAPAHRELHCALLQKFSPNDTEIVVPTPGKSIDF